jgi:hypothetical protein|tara:strand:- start:2181 stop:2387 length:207 start_codon:yes stop_codon:yes gene_type:complete
MTSSNWRKVPRDKRSIVAGSIISTFTGEAYKAFGERVPVTTIVSGSSAVLARVAGLSRVNNSRDEMDL